MENLLLNVPGISCSHCEMSIKKGLGALKGIGNVIVDLNKKTVSLEYEKDKVSYDQIKTAIEDQGYDIE
jgi:copper chaperone